MLFLYKNILMYLYNNMIWNNNLPYLYGETINYKIKKKIASFDIDGTIITTKSGKVFPKDYTDWIFLYENTVIKLKEYYSKDYCIIFISNQGGLKTLERIDYWKKKINNIVKEINIPICVYASTNIYFYRKPLPTIWDIIKFEKILISNKSFYCGDAAGRKNDHNNTDYKFAMNCGIEFMTPEMCFLDKLKCDDCKLNYPNLNEINYHSNYIFIPKKNKELIIIIGFPGSGKSTFFNKYVEPFEYIRINQDTLKTKNKCISETEKYMIINKNIVIDSLNYTKKIRKQYINIANKYNYNIRCIVLKTSFEISKHNMLYRYYKSNGIESKIPDLVYNKMKKNLELPDINEGIGNIEYIDPIKPLDNDYNYYMY
jgi:bifunctional polynucleotide phosphatase/kinase